MVCSSDPNKFLFSGTFYLYAGLSLLGMITVGLLLPETKNKTLEQVEELFMSKEYKRKHKIPRLFATDNAAFEIPDMQK